VKAEGHGVHEVAYVVDSSLRRQAVFDWLWYENVSVFAYSAVLVVCVLFMVFSVNLRLFAAVVSGFALAYFMGLTHQLVAAARREPVEIAIRLSDDAFVLRSPNVESTYGWSAIPSLSLTRRFVLLIAGDRSLAIPRSALSDEALAFLVSAARAAGAKVRGT
jgi:hypothetical protein